MSKLLVQVCGDPTVNWLSVRNEEFIDSGGVHYWLSSQSVPKLHLNSQAGGSALFYQLLKEMISPDKADVEGPILDQRLLDNPRDSEITTSWTVWRAFLQQDRSKPTFRLSKLREYEPGLWNYDGNKLSGFPELLVIDDSGLGFRNAIKGWPEALDHNPDLKKPEHIILRLAKYNDGRDNPLLKRLNDIGLAKRATIMTSIIEIRSCAEKIGVSQSWERMFEEIVNAVLSPACPFVDKENRLAFHQVIVTVGASGAVIVGQDHNSLIFDRFGQEDDFTRRLQGQMIGYNTCVMGALATAWTNRSHAVNWAAATRAGIGLARLLHVEGYEIVNEGDRHHLQFPCKRLAAAYNNLPKRAERSRGSGKIWDLGIFRDAKGITNSKQRLGKWSILEESIKENNIIEDVKQKDGVVSRSKEYDAVAECARRIVKDGPRAALSVAPMEIVGNWRSADRHEIEGVRSVNNAIRDYLAKKNIEIPLCVAVFGPPGSGKSFAVKEIARGSGIDNDAQLNFNLSQFELPQELSIAFNQIRDLNLKGKTPLVFWDEFDTPCQGRPLGWLQYFLAPMQDGEFTEQGRVRPTGGGIFVFAGATRPSFDAFCAGASREDLEAKKPDFISRLRAYIDVRGLNGNPNTIEDRMYMIRRAFLLNHYLETDAPQIKKNNEFQIEKGVLDAFLKISRYRHGVRSLETLVKMSNFIEKQKYELSSLPPDHILQMHVNAKEFTDLTEMGYRDILRVGSIGHIGLDPDKIADLQTGIANAVNFIEQAFPGRRLTAFSSLAAGTDRIVARALLKKESVGLVAVLPVSREDYINDFGSTDDHHVDYEGAELRQEFRNWLAERAIEIVEMPPAATRREAYLKTSYFIVEHSDVMIILWDGKKVQGKGSIGDMVEQAKKLGKPIIHIWAGNYKEEIKSITDVGNKCGKYRRMNFPGHPKGKWISE